MSVVHTEPAPVVLPAVAPSRPGLRLLPAPSSEPPYDDERPGGRPLPLRSAEPPPAPRLRLVPSNQPDGLHGDAAPARSSDLPAAQPFAHALVQRWLEVVAGVRPVAQLRRDTSLDLYEALERSVTGRPRATGVRPDGRSVRGLRVQEHPEGIAEVSATVRRPTGRYGALALRLEGVDGRWCCTELFSV